MTQERLQMMEIAVQNTNFQAGHVSPGRPSFELMVQDRLDAKCRLEFIARGKWPQRAYPQTDDESTDLAAWRIDCF